jgi:bifunctional non-homologous end joining protein LigD
MLQIMRMPKRQEVTYRAQLATLVDRAPEGDQWLHELKYDGYRLGCTKDSRGVRLESRRGNDWTQRFPELARAVEALPGRSLLIDGEVTALLPDGRTSFQALQNSFGAQSRGALAFFAFDLLHVDGRDLTGLPLEERKRRLELLLMRAPQTSPIRYADHVVGSGARVFEQACQLSAEGVVSKKRSAPYRPGRNRDWLKIKCVLRQEFVVGGFTDPEGSRNGIGSMLVGYYAEPRELKFAGKVGTGKGFGMKFWRELRTALEQLEQKNCPFVPRPAGWLGKHAHWVRPDLVIEVVFTEWTEGGHIRHPSLVGFRRDKAAREVVRERAHATTPGVNISTPERVLYPKLGLRKRDLVQFYADIADWVLPHLRGRPLTLVRCEHGAGKSDALRSECQFLRHTSGWHRWVPASVHREQIPEQKKCGEYLVIQSAADLLAIINGDILELHVWNATIDHIERPDRLVFDLDPAPDVPWRDVLAAALFVRERLRDQGLQSFVKTTGGKGLHVAVPLRPDRGWDACYAFAQRFAQNLVRAVPDTFTTTFGRSARKAKILVDYKRNHRAAVAVAAFSTRARPQATVSVPLAWEELAREPGPDRWTVRNLVPYLRSRGVDPWEEYWRCSQSLEHV